jgi:hypothetical protein
LLSPFHKIWFHSIKGRRASARMPIIIDLLVMGALIGPDVVIATWHFRIFTSCQLLLYTLVFLNGISSPRAVGFLGGIAVNIKRIFFRLREIWNIFSRNMIKCFVKIKCRTGSWKYVAFYHVEWKYLPYFTKNEKITFLFNFIIKENGKLTNPLACYQLQLYSAQ